MRTARRARGGGTADPSAFPPCLACRCRRLYVILCKLMNGAFVQTAEVVFCADVCVALACMFALNGMSDINVLKTEIKIMQTCVR
jgi:hypothetical protein